MSNYVLHLLSPGRTGQPATIAGDHEALSRLMRQLERVVSTGAATAQYYASDGEPFALTVLVHADMSAVYTSYRDEPNPLRSLRERLPLQELGTGTPKIPGQGPAATAPEAANPPPGNPRAESAQSAAADLSP